MGKCFKICFVLFSLILVCVFVLFISIFWLLTEEPSAPRIDDTWWIPGRGQNKGENAIRPFKLNVPEKVIKDLQYRLENTFPLQPPLIGVNQHYGINSALLDKIVTYWKTKYNWKERQEYLNQLPQFVTIIQGLDIHFIHAKPLNVPEGVEVLPLLLIHGWPGSFREFYDIIPILTTPQKGRNFVFEVVAPSLPGYGFSNGAPIPGLGPPQIAQIFNKLMTSRLKFNKYYVQGGDWGSTISHCLAVLYPNDVIGVHSNMCFVNSLTANIKMFIGSIFPTLYYTEEELKLETSGYSPINFLLIEGGYLHIQATKPDTVGVGLRDSPVGLAAYILEKFITWTNPEWKNLEDGGLTNKFTYDQLLDNVMIYWITRSITTSMRLYSENFNSMRMEVIPVRIPSGCARFKNELIYYPESLLRSKYTNLVHLKDYNDGGHFAAFEVPNILAEDIFQFVEKVRNLSKNKNKTKVEL